MDKIFEDIIYEKNALANLCGQLENAGRVLIVSSPYPIEKFFQRFANLLEDKQINYKTFIVPSQQTCNLDICKQVEDAFNGCEIIVGFGGNKVCNVVKFVGSKIDKTYYLVPTHLSHYGYFSDKVVIDHGNYYVKKQCLLPEKIYIDEQIVLQATSKDIFSCASFIFSHFEFYISGKIEELLQIKDANYELNKIYDLLVKVEGLINYLALSKQEAILSLMDYLIELYFLTEKCELAFNSDSLAQTLLKTDYSKNYCEVCLEAASVIMKIYQSFFSKKDITKVAGVNVEKLTKSLLFFNQQQQTLSKFITETNKFMDISFIPKLAEIKQKSTEIVNKISVKSKKINQKIYSLKPCKEQKFITEKFYSAVSGFPALTKSSTMPKILMRFGYFNLV